MSGPAATVPLSPGPCGPGLGASADHPAITLSWAELDGEIRQTERTGLWACPVRLRGRIDAIDLATGELRPVYDTGTEPGGVLLTACGNRRETVCPACSQVYKRDARQLVRAGLTGGKAVPDTIAAHPCVFATFTAPSFGPVHSRRMRGKTVLPCRPRRDHRERRCPHGRDVSCPRRHPDDDPRLGRRPDVTLRRAPFRPGSPLAAAPLALGSGLARITFGPPRPQAPNATRAAALRPLSVTRCRSGWKLPRLDRCKRSTTWC